MLAVDDGFLEKAGPVNRVSRKKVQDNGSKLSFLKPPLKLLPSRSIFSGISIPLH